MSRKLLFNATFEESLKLGEDKISGKFSESNVESALEKEKYRGTIKSYVWLMLLTLIFVYGLNYFIVFLTGYLYNGVDSLSTPLTNINFLPDFVFIILATIWTVLVLVGKRFDQQFILIYRGQFHLSVTYIDKWISKIIHFVFRYGWILVILGLVIRFIFPETKEVRTDWIGYLVVLSIWFIGNILVVAVIAYLIFPYMLQGYYKLKYREKYREWEGQTLILILMSKIRSYTK